MSSSSAVEAADAAVASGERDEVLRGERIGFRRAALDCEIFVHDLPGVAAAAADWALNYKATKYVSTIAIAAGTGVITITYGAATPQIAGNTIILTPNVPKGTALAAGATGNMDWACNGNGVTTSTALGLVGAAGTVLERYSPTQCK